MEQDLFYKRLFHQSFTLALGQRAFIVTVPTCVPQ